MTHPPLRPQAIGAAIVVTALLGWSSQSAAQSEEADGDIAKLLAEAESITTKVGQIRGLPALGPIDKGTRDRDSLRGFLAERFAREYPQEAIDRQTKTMVRMGLLEPGFDYAAFLVDLLTEQIAGFYDDETGELVVMDNGMGWDEQRLVMAHELFHALQDQHFGLGSLQPGDTGWAGAKDNEDRALARAALIEGDATALMLDFALHEMGNMPYGTGASLFDNPMAATLIDGAMEQMGGSMTGQGSPVLEAAPEWIQTALVFPYISGLSFVAKMRKDGAWDALNNVYANPPESTEQILHPERYLAGDAPVLVVLDQAAIAAAMGSPTPIFHNVHGELQMRLWLGHHLTEAALGKAAPGLTIERAAEGWDGDRYVTYEYKDGRVAMIGVAIWDSEQEAKEFAAAWSAMMGVRAPGVEINARRGEHGGSRCAQGDTEMAYVERWGEWVFYADGLPPETNLDVLRAAVWAARSVGEYPPTKTRGPMTKPTPEVDDVQ